MSIMDSYNGAINIIQLLKLLQISIDNTYDPDSLRIEIDFRQSYYSCYKHNRFAQNRRYLYVGKQQYEEDNITQQISGDKLIENEQTQQFQDKIDKYSRIYFPDQPQYIIGKKNKKNEIYIYNLISNQETFLGSIRANENCSDYECFGDKYFISLRDRTLYFSRAQNLKSLYSFKLQKYLEKIEIQNKILIMKEGFLYKQIYFCIKTSNKIKLFRKFNIKYYRDYKIQQTLKQKDILLVNILTNQGTNYLLNNMAYLFNYFKTISIFMTQILNSLPLSTSKNQQESVIIQDGQNMVKRRDSLFFMIIKLENYNHQIKFICIYFFILIYQQLIYLVSIMSYGSIRIH
ncbi:hypothetical protein pb186bvf_013096 [Paramecium bursaria]